MKAALHVLLGEPREARAEADVALAGALRCNFETSLLLTAHVRVGDTDRAGAILHIDDENAWIDRDVYQVVVGHVHL